MTKPAGRGMFMNSWNVEDAISSTYKAPKAMGGSAASSIMKTYNGRVMIPIESIEIHFVIGNNDIQNYPSQQTTAPPLMTPRPNPKKDIPTPAWAKELIGRVICKECDGVSYIGTVVGYNVQRKWFRVEYDEEGFEDMEEQDVRRLATADEQIKKRLKRRKDDCRKKLKRSGGNNGTTPRTARIMKINASPNI